METDDSLLPLNHCKTNNNNDKFSVVGYKTSNVDLVNNSEQNQESSDQVVGSSSAATSKNSDTTTITNLCSLEATTITSTKTNNHFAESDDEARVDGSLNMKEAGADDGVGQVAKRDRHSGITKEIEMKKKKWLSMSIIMGKRLSGVKPKGEQHNGVTITCCLPVERTEKIKSDLNVVEKPYSPTSTTCAPLRSAQQQSNTTTKLLVRRALTNQQTRHVVSSLLMMRLRTLISLTIMSLSTCLLAQAGFWTFYFPNFLKPSGYKELSDMIYDLERQMNLIKDTYADTQYFWRLMEKMDTINPDQLYPEISVCADVFPIFRDLAIEYTQIDYEHYMKPMEEYREHLIEFRSAWFRDGEKTKTVLPREWEQRLQEKDLELKITYHAKLTNEEEFRKKREKMVKIWRGVRRSMDSSLTCLYLKYAFRQISTDINQLALDLNLDSMIKTMNMLQSANKRIELFKNSDNSAIETIKEVLEEEERFQIKN